VQEKSSPLLSLPEKNQQNKIYFMLNIVARGALRANIPKSALDKYSGACLVTIDFKRRDL